MNAGFDLGYWSVKGVTAQKKVRFVSAVGTPDKARFSLTGNGGIVLDEPFHVSIGEQAVLQSRFLQRREDRTWIESDEYYALFLAMLTELTTASKANFRIVTGLPIAFYDGDKDTLRNRLLGRHRVRREGRGAQLFDVFEVKVIPQPFGCLLAEALNDRGEIVNLDIANYTAGVIDIGGKTVNIQAVHKLSEIARETVSVNVGAWDAVRAMQALLPQICPGLDLRDHEIVEALMSKKVPYYDGFVDISQHVEDILDPMSRQIVGVATQLWNSGAHIHTVLITGGGAILLGDYIKRHFRHARVVENPVFANAIGFWKAAERLGRK